MIAVRLDTDKETPERHLSESRHTRHRQNTDARQRLESIHQNVTSQTSLNTDVTTRSNFIDFDICQQLDHAYELRG